MEFNFLAILTAAFSSFVVGFVWYNPKVFGTIWMKEAGFTQEQSEKGNMLKIFGLSFVYSFMIAFLMPAIVIHQMGAIGMIGGPALAETAKPSYLAFMADYGDAFRTFKHGALHGCITGIFLALPIICINGLFEQKSWKYMAIQAGYWIVILTIMGSVICGWK
ncbi:DUF1761 domain-containing protein [Flavobacterium franklandianum]|uniref:DUF1761 domain-containing protein n=1 Tax=Flavobacterium franklandianum TaxID=2594430 RepID=A0A553CQY2_9FLAO|nr:DUF1761 domain-containing protein [Flavobacterium franklandianum]TRX22861.1 DUF1761 domain-containing protein [Flavobacterium franklandianum]TRX24432.1 DUF1761 domain-containing protein [Flavobacterium franklandianum]